MNYDGSHMSFVKVERMKDVNIQLIFLLLVLIFVLIMSLIPGSFLPCIYVTAGSLLGISEEYIHANVWDISNYGHLFSSSLLTFLIMLRYPTRWFILPILILLSLALIECLQYFIPNRQASFADLGFDAVGVGFALLIVFLMRTKNGSSRSDV